MSGQVAGVLSPTALPGPDDIHRVVFPNGIVVLARANFHSPSVWISGYLPAGALLDPDDKLGLADFTASALMRGAGNRDFQQIYEDLESVGASLGFEAHTHTIGFSGKALAEDIDAIIDLLGDTLRFPTFPPEQVERLRAQLLTGLALRGQNTAEMASMTFDQLVYENHPYSRPEDGYQETVQAIAVDDLDAFHRQHYGPVGLVVVVVGAVEPTLAVEKLAATFGDWRNPTQDLPPSVPSVAPLRTRVERRVEIPGKSQADLVMGCAGPPRVSDDFLPASVGNNVLGQFGLYGRIGEAVRERAGLAYYAYSSLSGGVGPGPWTIHAGVDPAHVGQAVDLILAEVARFVREEVSKDELEDSKSNFIGRLPLSLQSNAGVAGALINLERYDLGLDYYHRYPELVRAITRGATFEAARRYLHPDRLGIAIAGP